MLLQERRANRQHRRRILEIVTFRDKVLQNLREFYGHDAGVISISIYFEEGGLYYVGIVIRFTNEKDGLIPIICINDYFEKYRKGDLDFETCIGAIINYRESVKSINEK